MGYRHILIPIDGSSFSFEVLKEGLKLSKIHSSIVTVLFVIPTGVEFIGVYNLQSIKKAFKREGEKILEKAQEIAKKMNISISVRMSEGKPFEEIVKVAEMLRCDLIVMGSQGRGAIGKFFLGSCTERVLAESPCPVLVIKS